MTPERSKLQVTVEGSPVQVRRGKNDIFWCNYERGAWESETRVVFRRFIDTRHSYVDIGAWIGPTLLLASQLAKRAYGIEPDPVAYDELAENIEGNPRLMSNVQLFNICITPVSGRVAFGSRSEGGDSTSSLLFSNGKTRWEVHGITFSEWIERNQIIDCNFIKIDIEGGEYSVLPTMAAYLRDHRPTLFVALHPALLGDSAARGVKPTLKRSILRLHSTIRILKTLSFYRYSYDPLAKARSASAATTRSRLHHFVARVTWKPFVLLVLCLRSIFGISCTLVATDQKWSVRTAPSV